MAEIKLPKEIIPIVEEACGEKLDNFAIFVHGEDVAKNGSMAEWILVSLSSKKTNKTLDLIVKQTVTANLTTTKALMDATYFNEIYFYKTIWAELDKFQRSFPGKQPFDKVPKYYASSSIPGREKLVLENLIALGFEMFPRSGMFDEDHMDLLLKSYGHFHGVSTAFRELHPERFRELTKEIRLDAMECLMNVDVMNQLLVEDMRRLRETVEDPTIKEKLKDYCDKPLKMMLDAQKYKGKHLVINHGDPWSNNMMFKYDKEGELLDFRMFDYQLLTLGSVVLDLSFLIYPGVNLKNANFHYYLKKYHDSFADTLQHFKLDPSKIFTLEDLKKEWKEYHNYGFVMSQLIIRSKFAPSTEKMTVVDLSERQVNPLDKFGDKEDPPEVKDMCVHLIKLVNENNFL